MLYVLSSTPNLQNAKVNKTFKFAIIWQWIQYHSKYLKCSHIGTMCDIISDFYLLNNFKFNLQYVRIYKNTLNLHQICTMWLDGICYPAPGAKLKQIYKFACMQIWSKVCDIGLRIKFAHTFAILHICESNISSRVGEREIKTTKIRYGGEIYLV
jgi:hypothetical protein